MVQRKHGGDVIRQPVRAAAGANHGNWVAGALNHYGEIAHIQPERKLREMSFELAYKRAHLFGYSSCEECILLRADALIHRV